MVLFNHAAHQMAAKIVYYGPGLCGKTTNLATVHRKTATNARGEMLSLNTDTDRTLFFDLLPMDMGVVWGFRTKLQLYTVPGQVFYNATRKMVLKGADGIVFVADSQAQMLAANVESLRNLEANLAELGLDLRNLPLVFQWNKRDLAGIVPVDVLERELNPGQRPSFCSIASDGSGVFETLKGITRQTLVHIQARHFTPAGAPHVETPPGPLPPPLLLQPKPALQGRVTAPLPLVSLQVPRIQERPPVPSRPPVLAPHISLVPAARLPRSGKVPPAT